MGPVARNSLSAGIKLRRRARIRRTAGGAAVVIAMAAVIPAAIGTLGNPPAARHHQWPPDAIVIAPDGKTAYATNDFPSLTLTPINLVTNTPGKPIKLSEQPQAIAMARNGKAYVAIQTDIGGPKHFRAV
jgi:DNA-binding beta-propeller fold protein YncE